MTVASEVTFRQGFCRADGCGALFWICRCCDRGQRYCSCRCRSKARRKQRRDANRRHQQSPEGRLDHRDRQRAYRRRRALARVTDQGSRSELRSGRIAAREAQVQRDEKVQTHTTSTISGPITCMVFGHILEPLQSAVPVVGCPASFLHFLIPEPYIWSSSSIKLWRTSCAVTSGPSTHGRAALVSY